jgi:HlyD family secretion protein
MKARPVIFVTVAIVLIAAAWWFFPDPDKELIHGDIEVREIRVASKIPGRVINLPVTEGDMVEAGQLLFELSSPELDSKLEQAEAAEDASKAQEDEAKAGLRREQIEIARLDMQRATTERDLTNATLKRMQNLYADGLVSRQQLDEISAKAAATADKTRAAQAAYQMATSGAREEQLRAVEAQNRRAKAAVSEVQVFRSEAQSVAPIAGQVANIVIKKGELAPAGYPVITLIDPADSWVVMNIREDKLNSLTVGTEFTAYVPALAKDLKFKVSKLNPLPSFANWKQAKGTPGYDLKTFQIEARPTETNLNLKAGMTVVLSLEK